MARKPNPTGAPRPTGKKTPLSDFRALAEVVADVLAERGLVVQAATTSPVRVLDAAQVARLLGRDRHWVYDHAGELGAFRYGDGPRARLGFDLVAVERWKRERQIRANAPQAASGRGRRRPSVDSASDLIPHRAPGPGA